MDAKLTGHVLVNARGQLLTHKRWWQSKDTTGGWVWSDEEISQIVAESSNWEHKPVYKQAAYLNREDGKTVIYGNLERVS